MVPVPVYVQVSVPWPVTGNTGAQLQLVLEVPPSPVKVTPEGTGSVILIVVPDAIRSPSFFTVSAKTPVPASGLCAKLLASETSTAPASPVIFLLLIVAMVMREASPGATVTVEVCAPRLQVPCWPGGIVAQPTMVVPALGISLMRTEPAATSMAGEQAPAGTANVPGPPGLTVKLKLPCTSPFLHTSKNPVRLSVNVTSVTPLPIVTATLPPARLGAPSSRPGGATVMLDTV